MFGLWPRTQVAAAPKRAPADIAGVTTVPGSAFSDGIPPTFPGLMSMAAPPDPLKLRVRAESLRLALPMPAAEILPSRT